MRREKKLTGRLRTLRTLNEAVTAMKSLSAHHFLLARRSLDSARRYRLEINNIVKRLGLRPSGSRSGPTGLLLVTSDLGLCGDYNSRLTASILPFEKHSDSLKLYVVGRRGCSALKKQSSAAVTEFPAPASVVGLPMQLLDIAELVVADYAGDRISRLFVNSARFQGAGRFDVESTQLLPIPYQQTIAGDRLPIPETLYQSRPHLLEVAVREYLYITLYELLLDALASEHGMRLISAESARKWIEETQESVHRQLSAVRRENSTQEVLDIVASSRQTRRR